MRDKKDSLVSTEEIHFISSQCMSPHMSLVTAMAKINELRFDLLQPSYLPDLTDFYCFPKLKIFPSGENEEFSSSSVFCRPERM